MSQFNPNCRCAACVLEEESRKKQFREAMNNAQMHAAQIRDRRKQLPDYPRHVDPTDWGTKG